MPFEIVRNDIVNMQVDAVVNTANPNPVIGAGVDSGIHKKAGHEYGCESIAFPLISTGNYGFPNPLALQIAVREISMFLLENEMQIYLVVFGKEAFILSEKLFRSVSSYIDENYIQSKTFDEYGTENVYGSQPETGRIRERLKWNRRIHEDVCPPQAWKDSLDMSAVEGVPMESDDWAQLLKNLDAVGGAIHHIGNVHKYARKEDVPEKTLFIITTDGMENASHRYTYDKVRYMIERQKERYGWEFLFLGANMDAAAEARRFGIDESMAANYHCDEAGTVLNYEVISEAITCVRTCSAPLSADWKKKIDADYKKRGRKN